MDIRQAATDEGQDSGYGKAQQRHTEGDPTSSLGSDQRDMWRMGKAQELRVRRWPISRLAKHD